jgi:hypothetical protein
MGIVIVYLAAFFLEWRSIFIPLNFLAEQFSPWQKCQGLIWVITDGLICPKYENVRG